jgi:branched-chain amino acid transport system substrate-binding protein
MAPTMKKYSVFTLIVLLIFLPEFGLAQPSLKVGSLIPFDGRWGDSGRECAKGMVDAGKWLNQHGGVFGRKLEIILVDDTSQSAETMAAYRKLNESDRILVLYIYSMETSLALLPHIHYDRIPALISSLPSQLARPGKYPFLFSIAPTPLDSAKIAMKFISENSGIKVRRPKILFVGSSDYLGKHLLEEIKEYARTLGLDTGSDVLIPGPYNPGSALSAIRTYSPDFVYASLTSKEVLSMLQEAKDKGIRIRWVCSAKAFDENLAPVDGVLGVTPFSPFGENVPGMAGIKEAHQKWHPYDSHTLSYVEGWATVLVMAEALGRSLPEQKLSRAKLKDSLESFKDFVLGGLAPPLTFTAKDHRPSVESRIFITKEGKLVRHTSFISVGR